MTSFKLTSALAASIFLIAGGVATAADTSAAPQQGNPAKPAATHKSAAATAKPKTPESIECSKEADAKGLHGKARKEFRASCKAAIKAGKPVPEPKKT